MRDPVERAYSNWTHLWSDGLEPVSDFATAWAAEDGELDEHIVTAGRTTRRRLWAGDLVAFGRRHVHALTNPNTTTAMSIHVYSPPLRSMGFYRSDGEGDLVTAAVVTADDWTPP